MTEICSMSEKNKTTTNCQRKLNHVWYISTSNYICLIYNDLYIDGKLLGKYTVPPMDPIFWKPNPHILWSTSNWIFGSRDFPPL